MNRMIIKSFWEDFKKHIFVFLAVLVVILILLVVFWLKIPYGNSQPTGGELFAPDFKDGFVLYIEEGYSLSVSGSGTQTEVPHSVWQISDESLKSKILDLCSNIESYRQFQAISDIVYGSGDVAYYPRIYLCAHSFCYRIEVLNWENFSGSTWVGYPIREEMFGEPVLHIYRIDLSLMTGSENPFVFSKDYFQPDSVNSEGGRGWYSIMSQESMNQLLNLIRSIGAENAERAFQIGG